MNRFTISFIILVGVLFAGILILIYPSSIVSRLGSNEAAQLAHPLVDSGSLRDNGGLRGIIILGSVLTLSGLVGLAILGFRIFKDSEKAEVPK